MIKYYKIKDLQGGGLKEGYIFNSLEEVTENLRNFHSVDVENTDKMSLSDLCEIGQWEVIEIDA